MKTGMIALCVAGAVVVVTAIVGYLHGGTQEVVRASATKPDAPGRGAGAPRDGISQKTAFDISVLGGGPADDSTSPVVIRGIPYPTTEAMSLLEGRPYKLQGECAIRVREVLAMELKLKAILEEHKGSIEQLEIVGTLRGREGFAILTLPTDRFDSFVSALRGLGKMEDERITAKALKPGSVEAASGVSAVTLRFSDIDSSAAFDEGKGALATSFGRSASHALKGLAFLVETAGFMLPFVAAILLLVGPAWLIVKIARRLRAPKAEPGVVQVG